MRACARTAFVLGLLVWGLFAVACSDDTEPQGGEPGPTLQEALQAHADGDLDAAADLYKQVLVLDPENKFAYYNLGLIHQTEDGSGLRPRVPAGLDRSAFGPALFNLATVRTEEGAAEEAIDLYRQALEVNADNAAARLNLGFLLVDIGERKEGKAELAIAVQLDPTLESRIPDELLVVGDTTGP
jgi:tetratricopeptide (TPR) repeat protein